MGRIRARTILRPSEGAPGTLIDIDLKRDALFLFRGSVSIGSDSGWPYEVRVPVVPVATFGAGGDRVLDVGGSVDLSEGATLRFGDGRVRPAEDVVWITPDSSVIDLRGSTATGSAVGQAAVIGVWVGQVDTVFVRVVGMEDEEL